MLGESQLNLFGDDKAKPGLGKGFQRINRAIAEGRIIPYSATIKGVPVWDPPTASEFKAKSRTDFVGGYGRKTNYRDVDESSLPDDLKPLQGMGYTFLQSLDSSCPEAIVFRKNGRKIFGLDSNCDYAITPVAFLDYCGLIDDPFFRAEDKPEVVELPKVGVDVVEPPQVEPIEVIAEVVEPPGANVNVVEPLKPTDQAIALSGVEPKLPDLLRRSYKEFDMLDEWIDFCDRFPGLKWFVIDGVVLFPIPLVEKLKAENPGILSEDVYNKDYSRHFAEKHLRVPLGCSLKGNTLEIPPWVKSITEREGTKEAYQLKGYEDDPNAVGFVFEGGPHPRHYGKASYEAHQQIGAAMANMHIFHAVTFPVLYAYLVQGRSNISRRAQRLGSTAITQAVKQGIEARRENTPVVELAAAGAHDLEIAEAIQRLVPELKLAIMQGVKESQLCRQSEILEKVDQHHEVVLNRLEHIESGVNDIRTRLGQDFDNKLHELLNEVVSNFFQAERWLLTAQQFETALNAVAQLNPTLHDIHRKVMTLLDGKRTVVKDSVEKDHVQFLWNHPGYLGRCPASYTQIVGLVNGVPKILRDASGNKLGQVDHHWKVNDASYDMTWLVSTKVNQTLNNDTEYRRKLHKRFEVYQEEFIEWLTARDDTGQGNLFSSET